MPALPVRNVSYDLRYVLATFVGYAGGMTHTAPSFIQTHTTDRTFILRLTWDETLGTARILLKPVNGEAARLFSDVESALVYLETVMQAQQAPDPP